MAASTRTADEFLAMWDLCARTMCPPSMFPILNNGFLHLIATRLSVFELQRAYAMVFEVCVVGHPRLAGHAGVLNQLYCFGTNAGFIGDASLAENNLVLTADGPDGPVFDAAGWVRPEARALRLRGQLVAIPRDPFAYAAAGVQIGHAARIRGYELLRVLVHQQRAQLFLTDAEFKQRLVPAWPLLLRLEEWRHPDVTAGEMPSRSESFQMLARVLATGDASAYQPTAAPNTHWSNWPGGGAL